MGSLLDGCRPSPVGGAHWMSSVEAMSSVETVASEAAVVGEAAARAVAPIDRLAARRSGQTIEP